MYNRGRKTGLADGIAVTPLHNPPHDGRFKYNPLNGDPGEETITKWSEAKANEFLECRIKGVKRITFQKALGASTTHRYDYLNNYIDELTFVVNVGAATLYKTRRIRKG